MSFRRFTWLTTLFTLLFSLSAVSFVGAQTETAATAVVSVPALNVRSGPGVGNGVVAIVYQNEVVTLLERNEDSNWVRVRTFSGAVGWVSALRVFPSVSFQSLPVSALDVLDNAAAVDSVHANVRAGAGPNYGVVTVISLGQRVGVLGRNSDGSWLKVRTPNGTEGWVYTALLNVQLDIPSLAYMSSPSLTADDSFTATASIDGLRLRSGPGTNYGILTTVNQGTLLGMTGRSADGGWIRVQMGSTSGWVANYLIFSSTPFTSLAVVGSGNASATATAAPASTTTSNAVVATSGTAQGTATVFANALNMRSGPGLGYGVIGALGYADRVDMLGRSADNAWVKISYSGGQAWISSAYVYTSVYVYTLPVVN